MIDRDYSEKRSFKRLNMDAPAFIQLEDGSRKHCTCLDLSASGVSIEVDSDIPINTEVLVHIPALTGQFSPLDAIAVVLRSEKNNNKYILGLEIDKLK